MEYFLAIDSSTQWFAWIFACDKKIAADGMDAWNTPERKPLPMGMKCEFITRISQKRPSFRNRYFYPPPGCEPFYGWELTEQEYKQISRLIELYPAHEEFLKLSDKELYFA